MNNFYSGGLYTDLVLQNDFKTQVYGVIDLTVEFSERINTSKHYLNIAVWAGYINLYTCACIKRGYGY